MVKTTQIDYGANVFVTKISDLALTEMSKSLGKRIDKLIEELNIVNAEIIRREL